VKFRLRPCVDAQSEAASRSVPMVTCCDERR
jgi:hypothetical protein